MKKDDDMQWIDLENDTEFSDDLDVGDENEDFDMDDEDEDEDDEDDFDEPKKIHVNFHVVLLSLILLIFAVTVFKLFFWDNRVREDNEIESDTTLSFDTEPMDSIVPLDSSDVSATVQDDDLHILFLGNGTLAEEKGSDSNIANMIQKKTGATIYNCAIKDSYMSMKNDAYDKDYPYDALSFYNLCVLFSLDYTKTLGWAERDLKGLPEDVKESTDLLQSINYDELDVICIYYDAHDYLEQRDAYPYDKDPDTDDPATFSGALKAGIQLIQEAYPHVRIIVMSPTYAYAVDKNGDYSSSFSTDVLETPLYIYVIHEQDTCYKNNVSFVDNLYGSVYEKVADNYLEDHILLNQSGKELLTDRFIYALNRFNDYDFSQYE